MLTVCFKSFLIQVLKYIELKEAQRVINKRLKKPTSKETADCYYIATMQIGDMKTIRIILKK